MSSSYRCGNVLLIGMIWKLRWKMPNKRLVCVSHFIYLDMKCLCLNLLVSYSIACLWRKGIKVVLRVMIIALSKKIGMMERCSSWSCINLWKSSFTKSEIEGEGYSHFLSHLLCDRCFTKTYLENLSMWCFLHSYINFKHTSNYLTDMPSN